MTTPRGRQRTWCFTRRRANERGPKGSRRNAREAQIASVLRRPRHASCHCPRDSCHCPRDSCHCPRDCPRDSCHCPRDSCHCPRDTCYCPHDTTFPRDTYHCPRDSRSCSETHAHSRARDVGEGGLCSVLHIEPRIPLRQSWNENLLLHSSTTIVVNQASALTYNIPTREAVQEFQ